MNIGVYFARTNPTLGGGFTFESSIVQTLLNRTGTSRDNLILIGPRGALLEQAERIGMRTLAWPAGRLQRLVSEADARFSHAKHKKGSDAPRTAVDVALAQAGVDVLWSLGPSVPSMSIPFVVTVWDLQHLHQPWFPEVSVRGEWERRESHYSKVLRRAVKIIVGNSQGRDEAERYYQVPPDRVVCAPHPTPAWVQLVDRSVEVPSPDHPFVLYPAQFWAHKNHYHLLHAIRHLKDEGSSIRCVLVGSDGGNMKYVQRLVRGLDIEDRVVITGFLSTPDLTLLYRQATAVVYPSLFGPENLPPLEAMALDTPVIAARVSGTEEQLGDAAVMVDPFDPKAIASQILRVASTQEVRLELVRRGRQLVQERTPERFIDTVLEAILNFRSVRYCWGATGTEFSPEPGRTANELPYA